MSTCARVVALAASLLLAADGGQAQPKPSSDALALHIEAPEKLRPGSHAVIGVTVELGNADDAPILLTPKVEGSAVELVRGRLMRSDAKAQGDKALHFDVPVIARSEGTAILRIDVNTYVCREKCVAVSVSSSATLRVDSR